MIPGKLLPQDDDLEFNTDRPTTTVTMANVGDHPVQIGSHYHFYEVNGALRSDREAACDFRLNAVAGTAVHFRPGQERTVELVALAGDRVVYDFTDRMMGKL